MIYRYAVVQYEIALFLAADKPSYEDQHRKIGNFDPTIEVLLTMIIYMLQVQFKAKDTLGNESRLKNVEALPKAESKLFNYIVMQPIFREPNV